MTLRRGKGLSHDQQRAAERRRRREARRAAEGRPEDLAREERRASGGQGAPRDVEEDPDGRRLWGQHFERLPCVVCEDCPVDPTVARERRFDLAKIDGAHLISKDRLISWGLRELKWDTRNGLPVCRYHHFRHDYAVQRIPRRLLPAQAFEFADEIGARWVLEDDAVFPLDAP
jgi:hypothetical protein